jgi:hypothetical protein
MISFSQNTSQTKQTIADMKFMLEEEKVARDVYEYLDEIWNLRVFNNIKQSEQQHMDRIQSLLDDNNIEYKLSDERGVFYNDDLQKMYNNLIEKGGKSIHDAFLAGILIEEVDIADLEKAMANTNDEYIRQVYSNLLRASNNHLRAFNRQLSRL